MIGSQRHRRREYTSCHFTVSIHLGGLSSRRMQSRELKLAEKRRRRSFVYKGLLALELSIMYGKQGRPATQMSALHASKPRIPM
jgi:hypothetical protein